MRRDSGIPLYYQLETILRQKIASGESAPGQPLPSEDALAVEYGVSRITVRQALSLLEQDGLITRQRGRGTFVSETFKPLKPPEFSGSMEELIAQGVRIKVKVLSLERIEAPARIRESLELKPGEPVLMIQKVRLVEEAPLSYVINYLPEAIGRKVENADLNQRPLLMILEKDFGLVAGEAIQSVGATVADSKVAPLLEVRIGDPLLRAERTVYDSEGQPLEHVSALYRSDRYSFTIKLKRERSATSRGWEASFEPRLAR